MNPLPISNTRERKFIDSLCSRIEVLERALDRINFKGCGQCGEMYPPNYHDFVQTTGPNGAEYICRECLINNEDALADRDVAPHELNRHLKRWHGWTYYASNDGVRGVLGCHVQWMLKQRPSTFTPWEWNASVILWDVAESQKIKIDKGLDYLDPRKYRWNGQILTLKQGLKQSQPIESEVVS